MSKKKQAPRVVRVPDGEHGDLPRPTTKVMHTPGPWRAGRGVDDDDTLCYVTQGILGRPKYLILEAFIGAYEAWRSQAIAAIRKAEDQS